MPHSTSGPFSPFFLPTSLQAANTRRCTEALEHMIAKSACFSCARAGSVEVNIACRRLASCGKRMATGKAAPESTWTQRFET